jgi:t-SNARE complex subunit (syntaxin)
LQEKRESRKLCGGVLFVLVVVVLVVLVVVSSFN